MAIQIHDEEIERLAYLIAKHLNISVTEAIRISLDELNEKLKLEGIQSFEESLKALHEKHQEILAVKITKEDYDVLHE